MSTTRELLSTLQEATEQVSGKRLSTDEKNELLRIFNQGSGADFDRALNTISRFTSLSREEILNKTARSEQMDDALMALKETISNWRPGT